MPRRLAYILEGTAQNRLGDAAAGLKLPIRSIRLKLGGVYISKADLRRRRRRGAPRRAPRALLSKNARRPGAPGDRRRPARALCIGIPLERVWGIAWRCRAVALVAGVCGAAGRSASTFAMSLMALKALPVLIIGGIESIPGHRGWAHRGGRRRRSERDSSRRRSAAASRTSWRTCGAGVFLIVRPTASSGKRSSSGCDAGVRASAAATGRGARVRTWRGRARARRRSPRRPALALLPSVASDYCSRAS